MDKSPDAFRTIREVADWLGVAAHVLRFWESKFTQVRPVKRAGGRRYYRPADMELLGGIKVLLHDRGMTVRGVQRMLKDEGAAAVAALSPPIDGMLAAPELSEGIGEEDAWRADAQTETEEGAFDAGLPELPFAEPTVAEPTVAEPTVTELTAAGPADPDDPIPDAEILEGVEDGPDDAGDPEEEPDEAAPSLTDAPSETTPPGDPATDSPHDPTAPPTAPPAATTPDTPSAPDHPAPSSDESAPVPVAADPPPDVPPATDAPAPSPGPGPASMSRGLDAIWRLASEIDSSDDAARRARIDPALDALRALRSRVATEIAEDAS